MSPKYLRQYLMGSFENYIYPTWISYFVFIIMYQYGQHLFCFLRSVYLFLEDHIYRSGCWRNRRLKKQLPRTPIQKRKKRYKVLGQNLIKPRQHSCSIVKVLNSASEMKILQDVTDLWTMNITFYKEKLNPLSSLMTGATYWCKKQTAIVLVSDRQRNAASQKLSSPMILALYFIHVWTGVGEGKVKVFFNI